MNQTKRLVVLGTSAALIAACSSSKATSGGSTSPVAGSTSATQSSAAAVPSSSSAAGSTKASAPSSVTAAGLSGTWRGTYGGSYSGTFVLRWKQSSSKLTGTINLSSSPGTVPINGTVSGGRIQFGTVGSQAITYTGSVSGASMHGRYQIGGGAGGSGTWSAARQ